MLEEEETIADVEELKKVPVIGFEDVDGEEDVEVFIDGLGDGGGEIPEVIVDKGPGINEFVFVEEQPKPINMAEISKAIGYPQAAKDAGIMGNVVIRVLVNEKGAYVRHKVINSVHPLLDKAVEKQLAKLQFTPAIQGGKPIKFWVNIPFRFTVVN